MKKEKKGNILVIIKELLKTPRGKALVFFGIYFVFFLFLGVIGRLNNNNFINVSNISKDKEGSISKIRNSNYDFTYTIIIDGKFIVYSGSRNEDDELFNYNDGISNINYYKRDKSYFKSIDDEWVKAENPYIYEKFLDVNTYYDLFDNFTYVSKTSYQDGRESYSYTVSTTSIIKILESMDVDLDDLPNEVIVNSDSDGNINKIEMNLSSYGIFKGICSNNFSIALAYSNFDGAKVISPVN